MSNPPLNRRSQSLYDQRRKELESIIGCGVCLWRNLPDSGGTASERDGKSYWRNKAASEVING